MPLDTRDTRGTGNTRNTGDIQTLEVERDGKVGARGGRSSGQPTELEVSSVVD